MGFYEIWNLYLGVMRWTKKTQNALNFEKKFFK